MAGHWYNRTERHVHDGRMIAVEFETFILLATYVPNNGWTEASFARRRDWDSRVRKAVEMRAQNSQAKPIIWTGDLNVSATEQDVSDANFFRSIKSGQPFSGKRGGKRKRKKKQRLSC